MPVLEARLYQMRQAAAALRAAGDRVDTQVQAVHQLVDELLAAGIESPAALEFAGRYRGQKTIMDDWGAVLRQFAQHLEAAADEVEQAAGGALTATDPRSSTLPPDVLFPLLATAGVSGGVVSGSLTARYWRRKPAPRAAASDAAPSRPAAARIDPAAPAYTGYLAQQNHALYDDFVRGQTALRAAHSQLDELLALRQQRLEELAALHNRLASVQPAADVDSIPRVSAMKAEITALEQEVQRQAGTVRGLELDLSRLHERLERVSPAPGADLALVAGMEGAQTLQGIRENTYDCVHYIVNRMAIPPGLPTDAHHWVANVARMPEYGIRTGAQPLEGAVLVMAREHSYADDVYGHLMYVERVGADGVWVTDNHHAAPVRLADLTAETTGPHLTYLYFPWQTRG
ncbi:MAG: hypothetical protein MUE40_07015 [Anaerolineae bacterium]|nr:hypothetical protein [Anaerolineae bacterium]